MARRNRKRNTANGFLLPVPLAGVIVLLVSFALLYLWLDHQCEALGNDIKDLETRGRALQDVLVKESNRWTSMKSPENLERALVRHGLVMVYARPEQIVRVARPGVAPTDYVVPERYAQLATGTPRRYE